MTPKYHKLIFLKIYLFLYEVSCFSLSSSDHNILGNKKVTELRIVAYMTLNRKI